MARSHHSLTWRAAALALAFFLPGVCAANEVFSDAFGSGDFGSPEGQKAKWAVIAPATDSKVEVVRDSNTQRHVAVLTDKSAVADKTGTSTLVGSFQDTDAVGSLVTCRLNIFVEPTEATGFSAYILMRQNFDSAVLIRFLGKNRQIELKRVGEKSWKKLGAFESGRMVPLEVTLNPAKRCYDVQIGEEMVAVGEDFLSPVTGINRIEFGTGQTAASVGTLTIEKISITVTN